MVEQMKKYTAWYLRIKNESREVQDDAILKAIRHMIKCTTVRKTVCANRDKSVLVREADADIIGRPLFTLTNNQGVLGIIFPGTKADTGDYSIVEQFIDSFEHSDVQSHIKMARNKAKKNKPIQKTQPKGPTQAIPAGSGMMVISIMGKFDTMQCLIKDLSTITQGHPVQMSVINSV